MLNSLHLGARKSPLNLFTASHGVCSLRGNENAPFARQADGLRGQRVRALERESGFPFFSLFLANMLWIVVMLPADSNTQKLRKA